jgi:hypothetical protein
LRGFWLKIRRANGQVPDLFAHFAPAAETCARTMVESNIWIRCADELNDASVSKTYGPPRLQGIF